jgi:hypothetical protein
VDKHRKFVRNQHTDAIAGVRRLTFSTILGSSHRLNVCQTGLLATKGMAGVAHRSSATSTLQRLPTLGTTSTIPEPGCYAVLSTFVGLGGS